MSSVQERTHLLLEAAATNIQNAILSSITSNNDNHPKISKPQTDNANSDEENGLFSFMGNSSSQQNSSADDDDEDESISDKEDHDGDETFPNFTSFFKIFPSKRAITFIRKFAQKRNKNDASTSNSNAFICQLTFDDDVNTANILSSVKTNSLSIISSRLVELSDLHQPLGVGANAVVFRGKLLTAKHDSFPSIAVRCMIARIDKTRINNASASSSSSTLYFDLADKFCRGSAISCSLQGFNSPTHVMSSFGAFFIPMMLPTEPSVRYDYFLACSVWELAKDGFTWQEWVNNNSNTALTSNDNKLSASDSMIRTSVILRQFLELCIGVNQLHDQNIVHLDIKPRNAFVVDCPNHDEADVNNSTNSFPNVKLGDLDDCMMISDSPSATDETTNSHPVCGTCWYSAPESIYLQKTKSSIRDHDETLATLFNKSDIWSLGVSLLQMLNEEGRHMYSYGLMTAKDENQQCSILFDPQEMILERLEAVGKKILESNNNVKSGKRLAMEEQEKLELDNFLFGVDDREKWMKFCGYCGENQVHVVEEEVEKRNRPQCHFDEIFENIILKCIDLDPYKRPNISELIEKIKKLC